MFLELGIFASQVIWLWRVRHIRREAKNAGKTYDDYISAHPAKKLDRSPSSETVADLEAGNIVTPDAIAPLEKCFIQPLQDNLHTSAGRDSEKTGT